MKPQMIDAYSFGKIIINGQTYTADVIVFPKRVVSNWWRKEGHSLAIEDLNEAVEKKLEALIVGTGRWGLVKVPTETKKYIESKGIKLIIQSTKEACETYNRLEQSGTKVAAVLHLSC